MVRLQHLLDPSVESLNHAARRGNGPPDGFLIRLTLRVLRRGQTVLDAEVNAEQVEFVLAGGGPFAQTEQAVGEFLAIIGQHRPDVDRAGPFQVAQEPAGIGGGLGVRCERTPRVNTYSRLSLISPSPPPRIIDMTCRAKIDHSALP